MNDIPVYYCLDCGYVGNAPGNCPQCGGSLVADDMNLPNEKEEDEKYDDELMDDIEEEEEEPILEDDKFDDE